MPGRTMQDRVAHTLSTGNCSGRRLSQRHRRQSDAAPLTNGNHKTGNAAIPALPLVFPGPARRARGERVAGPHASRHSAGTGPTAWPPALRLASACPSHPCRGLGPSQRCHFWPLSCATPPSAPLRHLRGTVLKLAPLIAPLPRPPGRAGPRADSAIGSPDPGAGRGLVRRPMPPLFARNVRVASGPSL